MHEIIILCAKYVYVLTVVGWLLALCMVPSTKRFRFVLTTALGCLLAGALALLASHVHYEARPFVTQHIQPLIAHGADNGFPSDHALLTMALTVAVWWYNRRIASVLLVATLLVGFGRVAAHLHSPEQIVAGWVLAIVGVTAARFIVERGLKRTNQ